MHTPIRLHLAFTLLDFLSASTCMYQPSYSPGLEAEKSRKFGKQIQRQQLDLPEYAASFLNYKALKKV